MGNFDNFSDLINFQKIIIIEWKVGINIGDDGWTSDGAGAYYKEVDKGEILRFEVNGSEYTKKNSIGEVDSNAGSWYYDIENKKIYIHLSDGSNPEGSGDDYVGYVYLCFSNRDNGDGKAIAFKTNGETARDVFYKPILDVSSVPNITQKVEDYYKGALSIQFGSLSFLNDGWWWENRREYLYSNKEIWVKIGEVGLDYDDYVTVFIGKSRNMEFKDDKVIVNIKDKRVGILKEIPVDRFSDTITEEKARGKVVPILFGIKNGIIPVEISSKKYKVSQTIFNGVTYGIQSIDKVYLGERELTAREYTADLTNGEVTLLVEPKDLVVKVDAHGLKIDYDFTTGTKTGNFSENVADILFFILTELNGIDVSDINLDDFDDLKTARTQRLGWYLNRPIKTMEFIRMLQRSAIFHFIPELDGGFTVRYYDRDESNVRSIFDYDYYKFKMMEIVDYAFKKVVIKYDKDPSKDEWKIINGENEETGYKYGEEDTLTVETMLVDDSEAENLKDYYLALVKEPARKIDFEVNGDNLDVIPTDKIKLNRSIRDMYNNEINILEDEIYLILEVRKNIKNAKVGMIAIEDTQARGISLHGDIPHSDTHSDSYTDVHTDSAHTDTHSDTAHSDTHGDVAHSDDHDDQYTYTDHDDVYADGYDDHLDGAYIDKHTDSYNDHTDNTYSDTHSDVAHTDTHSDVPHSDTHGDGYSDSYTDSYTDEHSDIPHTDSEL